VTGTIQWVWKAFADLNPKEVEAIFQLRQAVFVVEQNCPYLDVDGLDDQALHLMGWSGDGLVATLRLFPAFEPYGGRVSIGRVCSRPDLRKSGIGHELMQQSIDLIDKRYAEKETQIGAQHYLKDFYASFGFSQCSEHYMEDGIEHILMLRSAPARK
jgi:ElaA protein